MVEFVNYFAMGKERKTKRWKQIREKSY